jgi:zinc transport system substrate-binding protein
MGQLTRAIPALHFVLLLAAAFGAAPMVAGQTVVFVSVPPQISLVRDIGGPYTDIHCLVQTGQDPHLFEARPKQILALARADVFLTVGMPFEQALLEKARGGLPRLAVVDMTQGFARRLCDDCGHDHSLAAGASGRAAAIASSDRDPHIWLSPPGLKIMAKNTADALTRADPAHTAEFRQRLKDVLDRMDRVDRQVRAILSPYRGRTVYVYHPALGYFCDAYGLRQKAVEVNGRAPSARQLHDLVRQAKEDRVATILVQRQFDRRGADIVAQAIGCRTAVIDPLAEDVVPNLQRIADAVAAGLGGKQGIMTERIGRLD